MCNAHHDIAFSTSTGTRSHKLQVAITYQPQTAYFNTEITFISRNLLNMPTTRRRGGNTAASRSGQSTLSFGGKSRVTKPSATSTRSQKTKDLAPISAAVSSTEAVPDPDQVPVAPSEPSQPHVAELAVRQQAREEIQQPLSEEDQKAIKITEQELQRYWKKEEQTRKAPRGGFSDCDVENHFGRGKGDADDIPDEQSTRKIYHYTRRY
jgi:predicted lipid-binding transport protein (Tim44 family)